MADVSLWCLVCCHVTNHPVGYANSDGWGCGVVAMQERALKWWHERSLLQPSPAQALPAASSVWDSKYCYLQISKCKFSRDLAGWLVWGSQISLCTALPFSEIRLFQIHFLSAALLLGNEGIHFDRSNPWVLRKHAVFPVTSCTFLHPRSYSSPA